MFSVAFSIGDDTKRIYKPNLIFSQSINLRLFKAFIKYNFAKVALALCIDE